MFCPAPRSLVKDRDLAPLYFPRRKSRRHDPHRKALILPWTTACRRTLTTTTPQLSMQKVAPFALIAHTSLTCICRECDETFHFPRGKYVYAFHFLHRSCGRQSFIPCPGGLGRLALWSMPLGSTFYVESRGQTSEACPGPKP